MCPQCSVLSETEKTFCPECGTPYFRGPAAGSLAAGPSRSNGKATAALVLGLVGLVLFGFILGLLAMVFAFIAIKEMESAPPATFSNRGSATAGLILGIIDVVLWFLLLVWIWWL